MERTAIAGLFIYIIQIVSYMQPIRRMRGCFLFQRQRVFKQKAGKNYSDYLFGIRLGIVWGAIRCFCSTATTLWQYRFRYATHNY